MKTAYRRAIHGLRRRSRNHTISDLDIKIGDTLVVSLENGMTFRSRIADVMSHCSGARRFVRFKNGIQIRVGAPAVVGDATRWYKANG